MNESQKCYAKEKRLDSKGYLLYDFTPITFQKRQIYRERRQISGAWNWV